MTTTRILLRSGKDPFDVVSTEQMMHRDAILSNSGNLLFQNAAHRLLLADDTEIVSNRGRVDPGSAARINEEFDVFAVPLANAFRPTFHRSLKALTDLVERLTIPVVVVGVGAQAGLDYDAHAMAPLDDTVRRFARAVLDRSSTIGVRGEFTAEYLARLGFSQTHIIGCPSMFLHGAEIKVHKPDDELGVNARLAVNVSRDAASFAPMLNRSMARYPETVYFAQEMKDVTLMYWGDLSDQEGAHDQLPVRRTHPLFESGRTRMHIDPAPWLDDLAGFDFSFGTRIHGNIAALLAGTPATVVCHDSRTLELCRYFSIPHRQLSDLRPDTDPAEMYAEADFTDLEKGHRQRFDRLLGFLTDNGLRNAYEHGDGGVAFDRRQADTVFRAPIEVWDGTSSTDLGYRMARLREDDASQRERQRSTDSKLAELRGRNRQLETRAKNAERRLRRQRQVLNRTLERLDKLERQLERIERRDPINRLHDLLRRRSSPPENDVREH